MTGARNWRPPWGKPVKAKPWDRLPNMRHLPGYPNPLVDMSLGFYNSWLSLSYYEDGGKFLTRHIQQARDRSQGLDQAFNSKELVQ